MTTKSYIKLSVFFILVVVPSLIWVAIYTSSANFIKILPAEKSFNAVSAPAIHAFWSRIPLVQADVARVVIDDTEIKNVEVTKRGFKIVGNKLSEGKHDIYAVIKYRFPFPKSILVSWSFIVDTIAPPLDIKFTNGASTKKNKAASPIENIFMDGKTEKKATVTFHASPKIHRLKNLSNGLFSTKVPIKNGKMELSIVSVDLAGNKTKKVFNVVSDTDKPKIISVSPTLGGVAREFPMPFVIRGMDASSWVSKASVQLGNKIKFDLTESRENIFTKNITFPDGKYIGTAAIEDAVGRRATIPINFSVDTIKVLVVRAERKLYLYKRGKVIRVFNVAVGKPIRPTPAGNFLIINKRINPTWVNPGSEWAKDMPNRIPPGPDNPLGTRAMDLSVDAIRIHGTPNAASIGSAVSNGCVRMYKWEAEELFRIVSVGTPVEIR